MVQIKEGYEFSFQLVPFTTEDFERLCFDFPQLASFWRSPITGETYPIADLLAVAGDSYLVRIPDIAPEFPYPHRYAFRHGGLSYEATLVDMGEVVHIVDAPALLTGARLCVEAALQAALDAHGYLGSGRNDGMWGELEFQWP